MSEIKCSVGWIGGPLKVRTHPLPPPGLACVMQDLKAVVLQRTVVSRFGCFVFEIWVLRFQVLGASFSSLGCFVFESWVLRFRDLGAPFSRFGCFVFEIWVLRASVFVYECFRFRNYQSFNTINHWSKTFLIPSRDNIYVLIGEKKSDFKKKCSIFAGLSIKKLKPSSCILAEKRQKMRYFKTIKPIKISRSKEVGAWN